MFLQPPALACIWSTRRLVNVIAAAPVMSMAAIAAEDLWYSSRDSLRALVAVQSFSFSANLRHVSVDREYPPKCIYREIVHEHEPPTRQAFSNIAASKL
jgi:hypothetical protein